MFNKRASVKRGPAFKPQLRVCYLCGQQFGSASIAIHIPQCYSKKVAQWEVGDPATRGRKPKHPDKVNWNATDKDIQNLNDEQFSEFTANLVPCKNCGRTFLPDRLPVHLRGCKGPSSNGGAAAAGSTVKKGKSKSVDVRADGSTSDSPAAPRSPRPSGGGGGGGASNHSTTKKMGSSKESPSRRSSSVPKGPAYKPQLCVCYLCGQQFGSASISIHVPQCYAKKRAQWEIRDPTIRGAPPKHPDQVNWQNTPGNANMAVGGSGDGSGGAGVTLQEYNDAQFAEFVSSLEPCPHCGRRFLSDRLVVHLRSCKPGSTSRPPPSRAASEENTVQAPSKSSEEEKKPEPKPLAAQDTPDREQQPPDRINPLKNRLPSSRQALTPDPAPPGGTATAAAAEPVQDVESVSKSPDSVSPPPTVSQTGKHCQKCKAFEPDLAANFCKECGFPIGGSTNADPCAHCGDYLVEGMRFCPTCGMPVNGAAAEERMEGKENENNPSARVAVCASCRAVCDADSNFCDNCGAALTEEAENENNAVANRRESYTLENSVGEDDEVDQVMKCPNCHETVCDLAAKFCEECGTALVKTVDCESPKKTKSTLSPQKSRELSDLVRKSQSGNELVPTPPQVPHPPEDPASDEAASLASTLPSLPAGRGERLTQKLRSNLSFNNAAGAAATGKGARPPSASLKAKAQQPAPAALDDAPIPPRNGAYNVPKSATEEYKETERHQCPTCERFFSLEALGRHSSVCGGAGKTRKVFNSAAHRAEGTEIATFKKLQGSTGRAASLTSPRRGPNNRVVLATGANESVVSSEKLMHPKGNWKEASNTFRAAMRSARQTDRILKAGGTAKDLPPPTYSENSHYVACPHCQRRFAPDVADRHIPRCATTINRPKPPPKHR